MAAVAGSVDAIGYLLLFQVFTSHMSGNSVALMVDVARADWGPALGRLIPIMFFFVGIVAGFAMTDRLLRTRRVHVFSAIAGVEVVLLLAYFALAYRPVH